MKKKKKTVKRRHNERQQNRLSGVNENKTQPPKTSSPQEKMLHYKMY
jgi:hypothetical protein